MPARHKKQSLVFERWPRFAYHHARLVLAGAVLLLAGLAALYSVGHGDYGSSFTIPGSEARDLFDLLEERFPARAGDTATVVVKADAGIDDPETRARIETLLSEVSTLPHVVEPADPYETPGAISADGSIARITVQYDVRADQMDVDDGKALINLVKASNEPGFQVEAGGPIIGEAEQEPPGSSELIGIAAAVVILLLAFGSVVAMGLPIATAILGITSGFFIVGIGASFVSLPSFTASFAAMIGLGVGIDYALLITNRFREAQGRGYSLEDSIVVANATAGRSVFFAGGTVVIALMGLWASGIVNIGWVGTAGAIVVLCSVAVALFALPAVLRFVGPSIDRWRIPFLHAPAAESENGVGYRLGRLVQRYPLPCLVGSLAVLLALASPVLDLELGTSDDGNNPESSTSRRAYDMIAEGFGPGANGPIIVGFRIEDVAAVDDIRTAPGFLRSVEDVAMVSEPRFNDDQTAAVITVVPRSAPQDRGTVDLVHRLREELGPRFEGTGAEPLVGGSTALFIDVGDHLTRRLPIFLGAVIALSFLLLMIVFRSVLVPLKAALMNLLSISAAFGILVAVFQWGWFGSVVGVSREGPVESFAPMMLFAVLFGLSMDYEVFLVSRIREEYVRTRDNAEAVARGLSVTTRVISAAAAIMVAVFLAFALDDQRVIKEFGIGLAAAIFLDATIVRLVLVPSLMQLAGDWNWWMPRWLNRVLPHVRVEGHPDIHAPGETPAGVAAGVD